MARFIEITRVYYAADKNGYPKVPTERVEVDVMVNVDRVVSFRPIDGGYCEMKTTDETFDVAQTYDFIRNLIHPPCYLGNPRG
jgi:hypothetical protein